MVFKPPSCSPLGPQDTHFPHPSIQLGCGGVLVGRTSTLMSGLGTVGLTGGLAQAWEEWEGLLFCRLLCPACPTELGPASRDSCLPLCSTWGVLGGTSPSVLSISPYLSSQ